MKKKLGFVLLFLLVLMLFPVSAFADKGITVFVDGNIVEFPSEPMRKEGVVVVPAEALLKALGVDIGVEIVNVQIINNYQYVPLRAVAENHGASVVWDNNKSIAYITTLINRDYLGDTPPHYTDYVPFSTGNLTTLIDYIAKGYVVYFDGQYWATSEYANMAANESTIYSNDIADDKPNLLLPKNNNEEPIIPSENEWITGLRFEKTLNIDKLTKADESQRNKFVLTGFDDYAFIIRSGSYSSDYYVDEMTDEFFNAENAEGTFNGIRMKKENGTLYFNIQDLEAKGIYGKLF